MVKTKSPRKPKRGTARLNFEVPQKVVEVLDQYAEHLSEEMGSTISRTKALVRLVMKSKEMP